MKTPLLASLLAILLSACSPDPGNTPKIAESQRDALEKAQGVQDTLNQGAAREDEEIEKQSEESD